MRVTIQELKNTIAVAKHTGEMECFTAKITNEHRDISIIVSYYPASDPEKDIYPYWSINMFEEEFYKTVFCNGHELHEVRDIYNGFINQGIGESYIEDKLIPH